MLTTGDKSANLKKAEEMIRKAAVHGADIIMLPEAFNTEFTEKAIRKAAELATEENHGETYTLLQNLAKETDKYIIGGTIPEEDNQKLFNTCLCFDRDGKLAAKYRKTFIFKPPVCDSGFSLSTK